MSTMFHHLVNSSSSPYAARSCDFLFPVGLYDGDDGGGGGNGSIVWNDSAGNNGTILRTWDKNLEEPQLQEQRLSYELLKSQVNHLVIPIICLIGICGNSFNCYVFYCRWYQKFMNDAEKSVTVGLISLSISDALFCLATLPSLFLYAPLFAAKSSNPSLAIAMLYYRTYKPFLMNMFLLASTCIISAISVQRLIAVTWTHGTRCCVSRMVRNTVSLHLVIFLFSFLACLPLLFRKSIVRRLSAAGELCYYIHPSPIINSTSFMATYRVFWTLFATLLPLVLLSWSNIRLMLILCHGRVNGTDRCDRSQITWLIVTIVTSFLLLVCPSMIVECLVWMMKSGGGEEHQQQQQRSSTITRSSASSVIVRHRLLMSIVVTNLLQSIKFSLNFLLYCSVNRQFRRELRSCRVKDSCRANRTEQQQVAAAAAVDREAREAALAWQQKEEQPLAAGGIYCVR